MTPSTPVVLLDLGADRLARTGDEVEDAVGDAGGAHRLEEALAGDRGVGRGLVDDRVAGHERAAGRPAGQGEGEVERADDAPHAVRPQDRAGMDGLVAEVAHHVVEAVVALHHVARPADEIGRLLDVAERLEAVLADLHREQGAELHLPLADRVGDLAEERHPLLPRATAPGRERLAGGRDRVPDVLPRPLRERAHDRPVDRRALLERAVAVALGAADEVAVMARRAASDGRSRARPRTGRGAGRCRCEAWRR